jgi:hypothetical protein
VKALDPLILTTGGSTANLTSDWACQSAIYSAPHPQGLAVIPALAASALGEFLRDQEGDF